MVIPILIFDIHGSDTDYLPLAVILFVVNLAVAGQIGWALHEDRRSLYLVSFVISTVSCESGEKYRSGVTTVSPLVNQTLSFRCSSWWPPANSSPSSTTATPDTRRSSRGSAVGQLPLPETEIRLETATVYLPFVLLLLNILLYAVQLVCFYLLGKDTQDNGFAFEKTSLV